MEKAIKQMKLINEREAKLSEIKEKYQNNIIPSETALELFRELNKWFFEENEKIEKAFADI